MPVSTRQALTAPLNIQQLLAAKQMGLGDYIAQAQMRNHVPSLRERIGNLIYDAAQGAGLRQSAHGMRSNAEAALDFLPGIGAAVGGEEAGRDLGSGHYLSGGAGLAMSMIPGGKGFHGSAKSGLSKILANPPERQFDNATSQFGAFFAPDVAGTERYGKNVYEAALPGDFYEMTPTEFHYFQHVHKGPDGQTLPGEKWAERMEELKREAIALKKKLQGEGYAGVVVKGHKGISEIASFDDVPVPGAIAGKVVKKGIKAFHATDKAFDKFDPGWRGAAFFASTPERAKIGATAGAQDLHHLYAPTPGEGRGPLNVMEVMLPADKIDGLHYTPSEVEWFNSLPDRATSDNIDDVLKDMPAPIDPYLWQTLYEERQLPDGTFEYIKKPLPQISYEDAYTKGRDVYGRQFAHYSDQTGEGQVAERVRKRGMGGYLVNDEAGLSIGVLDPSLIEILNRQ